MTQGGGVSARTRGAPSLWGVAPGLSSWGMLPPFPKHPAAHSANRIEMMFFMDLPFAPARRFDEGCARASLRYSGGALQRASGAVLHGGRSTVSCAVGGSDGGGRRSRNSHSESHAALHPRFLGILGGNFARRFGRCGALRALPSRRLLVAHELVGWIGLVRPSAGGICAGQR